MAEQRLETLEKQVKAISKKITDFDDTKDQLLNNLSKITTKGQNLIERLEESIKLEKDLKNKMGAFGNDIKDFKSFKSDVEKKLIQFEDKLIPRTKVNSILALLSDVNLLKKEFLEMNSKFEVINSQESYVNEIVKIHSDINSLDVNIKKRLDHLDTLHDTNKRDFIKLEEDTKDQITSIRELLFSVEKKISIDFDSYEQKLEKITSEYEKRLKNKENEFLLGLDDLFNDKLIEFEKTLDSKTLNNKKLDKLKKSIVKQLTVDIKEIIMLQNVDNPNRAEFDDLIKHLENKFEVTLDEIEKLFNAKEASFNESINSLKEKVITLEHTILEEKKNITKDLSNIAETFEQLTGNDEFQVESIISFRESIESLSNRINLLEKTSSKEESVLIDKIQTEFKSLYNRILERENDLIEKSTDLELLNSKTEDLLIEKSVEIQEIKKMIEHESKNRVNKVETNLLQLQDAFGELKSLTHSLDQHVQQLSQQSSIKFESFVSEKLLELRQDLQISEKHMAESMENIQKKIADVFSSLKHFEHNQNVLKSKIKSLDKKSFSKKPEPSLNELNENHPVYKAFLTEINSLKTDIETFENAIEDRVHDAEVRVRIFKEQYGEEVQKSINSLSEIKQNDFSKHEELNRKIIVAHEKIEEYYQTTQSQVAQLLVGKSQMEQLRETIDVVLADKLKEPISIQKTLKNELATLEKMFQSFNKMNKRLAKENNDRLNEVESSLQNHLTSYSDTLTHIKTDIDELQQSKSGLLNNLEKISQNGKHLVDRLQEGAKFEEEMRKRINELEKTTPILQFQTELDSIKDQIQQVLSSQSKITNDLELKISLIDQQKDERIAILENELLSLKSMTEKVIGDSDTISENQEAVREDIHSLMEQINGFKIQINGQIKQYVSDKLYLKNLEDEIKRQFDELVIKTQEDYTMAIDEKLDTIKTHMYKLDGRISDKISTMEISQKIHKESLEEEFNRVFDKITCLNQEFVTREWLLEHLEEHMNQRIESLQTTLNQRIRDLLSKEFKVGDIHKIVNNVVELQIKEKLDSVNRIISEKNKFLRDKLMSFNNTLVDRIKSLENEIKNTNIATNKRIDTLDHVQNTDRDNINNEFYTLREDLYHMKEELTSLFEEQISSSNDRLGRDIMTLRDVITAAEETSKMMVTTVENKIERFDQKLKNMLSIQNASEKSEASLEEIELLESKILDITGSFESNIVAFKKKFDLIDKFNTDFSESVEKRLNQIHTTHVQTEKTLNGSIKAVTTKVEQMDLAREKLLKNLKKIGENGEHLVSKLQQSAEFEEKVKKKLETLEENSKIDTKSVEKIVSRLVGDMTSRQAKIDVDVRKLSDQINAIEESDRLLAETVNADIIDIKNELSILEQKSLKERKNLDFSVSKIARDFQTFRDEVSKMKSDLDESLMDQFDSLLTEQEQKTLAETEKLHNLILNEKSNLEGLFSQVDNYTRDTLESIQKKMKKWEVDIYSNAKDFQKEKEDFKFSLQRAVERVESIENSGRVQFDLIRQDLDKFKNVSTSKSLERLNKFESMTKGIVASFSKKIKSLQQDVKNKEKNLADSLHSMESHFSQAISQLEVLDQREGHNYSQLKNQIETFERQNSTTFTDHHNFLEALNQHLYDLSSKVAEHNKQIGNQTNEIFDLRSTIEHLNQHFETELELFSAHTTTFSQSLNQLTEKFNKAAFMEQNVHEYLKKISDEGKSLVDRLQDSLNFEKEVRERLQEIEHTITVSSAQTQINDLLNNFEDLQTTVNERLKKLKEQIGFVDEIRINDSREIKEKFSNLEQQHDVKYSDFKNIIDEFSKDYDEFKILMGQEIHLLKNSLDEKFSFRDEFVQERDTFYNELEKVISEFDAFTSLTSTQLIALQESLKKELNDTFTNDLNALKNELVSKINSLEGHITDKVFAMEESIVNQFNNLKENDKAQFEAIRLDIDKELQLNKELIEKSDKSLEQLINQEVKSVQDKITTLDSETKESLASIIGNMSSLEDNLVVKMESNDFELSKSIDLFKNEFTKKISSEKESLQNEITHLNNRLIESIMSTESSLLGSFNTELVEHRAILDSLTQDMRRATDDLLKTRQQVEETTQKLWSELHQINVKIAKSNEEINLGVKDVYDNLLLEIDTVVNNMKMNSDESKVLIKDKIDLISKKYSKKIAQLENQIESKDKDLSQRLDVFKGVMSSVSSKYSGIEGEFDLKINNLSQNQKMSNDELKQNLNQLKSTLENFIVKSRAEIEENMGQTIQNNHEMVLEEINTIDAKVSKFDLEQKEKIASLSDDMSLMVNSLRKDVDTIRSINSTLKKQSDVFEAEFNQEIDKLKSSLEHLLSVAKLDAETYKKEVQENIIRVSDQMFNKSMKEINHINGSLARFEEKLRNRIESVKEINSQEVTAMNEKLSLLENKLLSAYELFNNEKEQYESKLEEIGENKVKEFDEQVSSKIQNMILDNKQMEKITENLETIVSKNVNTQIFANSEYIKTLENKVDSLNFMRRELLLVKKKLDKTDVIIQPDEIMNLRNELISVKKHVASELGQLKSLFKEGGKDESLSSSEATIDSTLSDVETFIDSLL